MLKSTDRRLGEINRAVYIALRVAAFSHDFTPSMVKKYIYPSDRSWFKEGRPEGYLSYVETRLHEFAERFYPLLGTYYRSVGFEADCWRAYCEHEKAVIKWCEQMEENPKMEISMQTVGDLTDTCDRMIRPVSSIFNYLRSEFHRQDDETQQQREKLLRELNTLYRDERQPSMFRRLWKKAFDWEKNSEN